MYGDMMQIVNDHACLHRLVPATAMDTQMTVTDADHHLVSLLVVLLVTETTQTGPFQGLAPVHHDVVHLVVHARVLPRLIYVAVRLLPAEAAQAFALQCALVLVLVLTQGLDRHRQNACG